MDTVGEAKPGVSSFWDLIAQVCHDLPVGTGASFWEGLHVERERVRLAPGCKVQRRALALTAFEDGADGAALVGVFDDDLRDQSPSLASEAVELAYAKPVLRLLDSVLPAIHGTSQGVRGDVCHSMAAPVGRRLRRGLWRLGGGWHFSLDSSLFPQISVCPWSFAETAEATSS